MTRGTAPYSGDDTMNVAGKVAVITGAASGIGRALATRFAREGAKGVVLADIQADALATAAGAVKGLAVACDVTREADIRSLVDRAEQAFGQVDIFVSNAGVYRSGGEEAPDTIWNLNWDIHVMSHVYAARRVIPSMEARGSGYFIITSSAAGLLSHISSATYAVSKHAAVALGEYLSITHGERGVRVSVLCPQAVRTAMTAGITGTASSVDGMLEPEVLADCVIETMDREQFLMLPHPTVLDYLRRKTADYDRWLSGMRKLRRQYSPGP